MKTTERILWRDIWYAASFEYDVDPNKRTHWIDWKLFPVMGFECAPPQKPLFTKYGAADSMDSVPTIDGAEIFAEGFIKWDGCMQFTCPGHMHIDTSESLAHMGEALQRVRDKAVALCGGEDVDREPRVVTYRAEAMA